MAWLLGPVPAKRLSLSRCSAVTLVSAEADGSDLEAYRTCGHESFLLVRPSQIYYLTQMHSVLTLAIGIAPSYCLPKNESRCE